MKTEFINKDHYHLIGIGGIGMSAIALALLKKGYSVSGSDLVKNQEIKKLKELGAGEILITSVDQDGTAKGPDKELIEKASAISKLPIIFGGGISSINDIEFCLGKKMCLL